MRLLRVALVAWIGLLGASFFQSAAADTTPWAKGESRPQDLVISLATFSPGDEIPAWFGHTGLIVEDRRHNVARLYNYGMFSFDAAMLMRFAMGRLWFWVAPTHVGATFDLYMRMDRDVRVLELNLAEDKRVEVAQALAENVRPENREYLYHHYYDNCSTRVRDIIDLAVDGQFSQALYDEPGRWTLREHTRRHSSHLPPMDWVLMYLMNNEIDRPSTVWEEMFLPQELERQVLAFDWVDEEGVVQPLVLRKHLVYESEDRDPVPEAPRVHWPWWLALGSALGAMGLVIGWSSRRWPGRASRVRYGLYHAGLGLLLGVPGTVLAVMALATDHSVTFWNQNLFWASPASLAVFVVAIGVLRGRRKAPVTMVKLWTGLSAIALLGVIVHIASYWVPALYQDMSLTMTFYLPIIAGASLSAWWVDGEKLRQRDSDVQSGR